MSREFLDYCGLVTAERDALVTAVAPLGNLSQVVAWLKSQGNGGAIEEIVTQDEYTHDVVVRWNADRFLVFDTT